MTDEQNTVQPADEAVEPQDSQNPDEELDLDLETEDEPAPTSPAEDVEAIKQRNAELEAKNKQLYARLKKLKPEAEKPSNSQPNEDLEWKRKIEFITTKGRNLDAEEVDEVIAYAQGKKISYDQALESPVVKAFLSERTAKKRVERATPSSSSKSSVVNGKSWAEMNKEERQANYSKLVQKRTGK